ncbi:hypothetical protein [Paraferrimonas sp. SM1919]|uniref:hypothetical protein n=1 Tax=Paraferrimonas sp. SM1919 TaxID=2662263 RepID=UPI0013D42F91|nr:hypothetical protein [Paraferrimonas sp. SM1919]
MHREVLKIGTFKDNIKSIFSTIANNSRGLFESLASKPKTIWHKLNFSQKCYLLAFVIPILLFPVTVTINLTFVFSTLACIGLIYELQIIFRKVWDTTIGRGLLIFGYIFGTNLTLALSAQLINITTGVEPTALTYSLTFTVMVLAPFWFTAFSIACMLILLIVLIIMMLFSPILHLAPIQEDALFLDKHYRIRSMLARLILIPVAMISLFNIVQDLYTTAEESEKNKEQIEKIVEGIEQKQSVLAKELNQQQVVVLNEAPSSEQLKEMQNMNTGIPKGLTQMVAHFVYYFESYAHSHCELEPKQHLISINEFEMLFITPDKQQPYGYKFEVGKCQPK